MPAAKESTTNSVAKKALSKRASMSKGVSPPKGGKISKKSKVAAVEEKTVKKRPVMTFTKEEQMSVYIYRCLKKLHPEIGISKTAMDIVNSILLEVYRKISREAAMLSMKSNSQTLTSQDV